MNIRKTNKMPWRVLAMAVAGAVTWGSISANAATIYWDRSVAAGHLGGNGTWDISGAANWGDAAGTATLVNWTNGEDAVFDASGTSIVTLGANNITAGVIQFTNSSFTIAQNASADRTLTYTRIESNALSGTQNVTFSVATNRTLSLASLIQDGGTGGKIGITKSGVGTLAISGGNTYSGPTVLSAGTLTIDNNSSLGTGTLKFDGGTLQSSDSTSRTLANVLVTPGVNTIIGGSGNIHFSDTTTITLNGGTSYAFTINNPITTFAQAISGGSAFTKAGTGMLVLNGNLNTATSGAINLSAGTLILNGSTTYSAGSFTMSAGTSLGGTGSLNKSVAVPGNVTVSSRGTIDLTGNGIGTFNLTNAGTSLTLGGAGAGALSNLKFDLGTSTNDQISAAGAVAVNLGGAQISIVETATRIATGQRTLLTYGSKTGTGVFSLASASGSGTRAYALSSDSTHQYLDVSGGLAVAGITLSAPSRALTGSVVNVGGVVTNNAVAGNNDLLVGLSSTGLTLISSLAPVSTTLAAGGGSTTYSGSFTAGAAGTTASLEVTETDSGGSAYYTGPASASGSTNIVGARSYATPNPTVNVAGHLKGALFSVGTGTIISSADLDTAATRETIAALNQTNGGYTLITAGSVAFAGANSVAGTLSGVTTYTGGTGSYSTTPTSNETFSYVPGSVNFSVSVSGAGNATAKTSADDMTFAPANVLSAGAGSAIAGLESQTSAGGSVLGTLAALVESDAATISTGQTISMNWRDRTTSEQTLDDAIFYTPGKEVALASDVVDLTGVLDAGATRYTLLMTYDQAGLTNEGQSASDGAIFLAYFNGTNWVNAGNLGTFATPDLDGYQPGVDFTLGKWGVDPSTNQVWAVVNHNSQFAAAAGEEASAIPEPTSLGLLALGGLALLGRRRK